MIKLPPKRPKTASGIERVPERIWPKHDRWVRSHCCVVPGCNTGERIELAHLRSAANAGTGLKPASWYTVSLCRTHHAQAHQIGHDTFAALYKIDLWDLAAEFTRRSPDRPMREAMLEQERARQQIGLQK